MTSPGQFTVFRNHTCPGEGGEPQRSPWPFIHHSAGLAEVGQVQGPPGDRRPPLESECSRCFLLLPCPCVLQTPEGKLSGAGERRGCLEVTKRSAKLGCSERRVLMSRDPCQGCGPSSHLVGILSFSFSSRVTLTVPPACSHFPSNLPLVLCSQIYWVFFF